MADKPSFLNALRDPRFREDVGRGLANALNRGMVAGTIGGPVDLATMALRPLGYNVEQPVGGSEWIGEKLRQMGYVTDDRNPVAEGLANALTPAALAGVGKIGSATENALAIGAKNMARPSSMPLQSQRGAVAMSWDHPIIGEIENAVKNVKDTHIGLRVLPEDHSNFAVGEYLPNSHVWEDGSMTDDLLDGVSTASLGDATKSDIIRAVKNLGLLGNGPNGFYRGPKVGIVGGTRASGGEDVGESVIVNGVLRWVTDNPRYKK